MLLTWSRHIVLATALLLARAPGVARAGDAGSGSETVVVVRGGSQYHLASCVRLGGGGEPMPLAEAAKRFRPCSVCAPPLADARLAAATPAAAAGPAGAGPTTAAPAPLAAAPPPVVQPAAAARAADPGMDPPRRRSRAFIKGLAIGAGTGVAFGLLGGGCEPESFCFVTRGDAVVILAPLGALVGGVLGGIMQHHRNSSPEPSRAAGSRSTDGAQRPASPAGSAGGEGQLATAASSARPELPR